MCPPQAAVSSHLRAYPARALRAELNRLFHFIPSQLISSHLIPLALQLLSRFIRNTHTHTHKSACNLCVCAAVATSRETYCNRHCEQFSRREKEETSPSPSSSSCGRWLTKELAMSAIISNSSLGRSLAVRDLFIFSLASSFIIDSSSCCCAELKVFSSAWREQGHHLDRDAALGVPSPRRAIVNCTESSRRRATAQSQRAYADCPARDCLCGIDGREMQGHKCVTWKGLLGEGERLAI